MLLPSFDTDESFHHLGSLVSPPTSPPTSHSSPTISSLFSTCRALQSMLSAPNQLPSPANSPPLLNTPVPISSNHKFRLSRSSRKVVGDHQPRMKMKVTKRQAVVPRGLNKRRRDSSDDGDRGHFTNVDTGAQDVKGEEGDGEEGNMLDCPSTPKRSRIAPESLPFGLQRSDFHDVYLKSMPARISRPSPQQSISPVNPPSSSAFTFTVPFHTSSPPPMPDSNITNSFLTTTKGSIISCTPLSNPLVTPSQNSPVDSQALTITTDNGPENNTSEDKEWFPEDDKILVEVILEKLKISKADLEDCARSLGRDRHSIGRRWKSLVSAGEIGLKNGSGVGSKRSQIYGSWR